MILQQQWNRQAYQHTSRGRTSVDRQRYATGHNGRSTGPEPLTGKPHNSNDDDCATAAERTATLPSTNNPIVPHQLLNLHWIIGVSALANTNLRISDIPTTRAA
ncbi:MAG: hypothetical protein ABGZ17_05660, partial [Planctomycetaceae bacterium]